MGLIFEWDENKARLNFKKHKVSFKEAKTIFNDPSLMTFLDLEHSDYEQRYINIGISSRKRFLIVIHTERGGNIRIISCRKATKSEQKAYENSI
jgi:hypothetical protein